MTERIHHRPARLPGAAFDAFQGGEDPAVTLRRAHESAAALLSRTRQSDDEGVIGRLLAHTDEHGLDLVARLWAVATPGSLPGALWRIHLLRAAIRDDAAGSALAFRHGTELLPTIDPVVAGAATPTGPEEILRLADDILRGVFQGDLADALARAGAYCRLSAAGWLDLADAREQGDPEHASALTRRADRLAAMGEELEDAARLERRDALD
ncbi:DNA-directed RNA polymerase subunit beta [Homoserinibacter sp. YIM 151385]|uniref:DNA-directed RNA polymerase subunit beta n=1 Tax=Homoserinibacter sp. YIM 151385 TaxID=2985506 RepID=UPI0022F0DE4E|nr:DNA-directed RNA polymerase subunit beta [Homoserinibacter sp. YIM 151385]WBU36695.1 DNA-directed RNA polymerase subunit beta [Homoserinibacter sp. YIM 151385]